MLSSMYQESYKKFPKPQNVDIGEITTTIKNQQNIMSSCACSNRSMLIYKCINYTDVIAVNKS